MQTHQPPYATEEHSAIHTIIHLGAGACRELEIYLTAQPARLLLVEADPQGADDLRNRTASLPQVEVCAAAVTTDANASILYRYNLPDVNSLHAPSGLWHLFPGLKLMDQIEVYTISPADLIAPMQLEMQLENRLIIDTPGEEMPILKALQESDHLHRFKYLYLHCGRNPLYETSVPGMQIVEWLQEEGFDLIQADDSDDPDRPLWILKRNQLQLRYRDLLLDVERLQQALEQTNRQSAERQQQIKTLTQARDEYKNLADECQSRLEKLKAENTANLETLNQTKAAKETLAQEKNGLSSRISNLESEFEKLQQERDAKAKALEQANQEKTKQTKLANDRQSQLEKLKQERDAKAKALEQANQEKTKQTKMANERQSQLEKLKAENTANLETLNQTKAAKETLAQEKADLTSRNKQLESKISEFETQTRRLSEQLEKSKDDKEILKSEIVKAEGQIHFIKDILVPEPQI